MFPTRTLYHACDLNNFLRNIIQSYSFNGIFSSTQFFLNSYKKLSVFKLNRFTISEDFIFEQKLSNSS